jgi:hypothetical protein
MVLTGRRTIRMHQSQPMMRHLINTRSKRQRSASIANDMDNLSDGFGLCAN